MAEIGFAAALLGLGGVLSAGAWGLLRDRRAILAGQAAQVLCFASHFWLIGARTGAAMCVLSVVQLAAAALPRCRATALAFWATAPAMAVLAWRTWQGPASGAAAVGLMLGMLGRWQASAGRMRWFLLGSSLGWASHNVLVFSPFGMATDALAITTNGWRLFRETSFNGAVPMRMWMRLRARQRAQLMEAMLARFGIGPEVAERHGRVVGRAARRCLWCPLSARCTFWLETTGPAAAMPFPCPNASTFARLAAEAKAAEGARRALGAS